MTRAARVQASGTHKVARLKRNVSDLYRMTLSEAADSD